MIKTRLSALYAVLVSFFMLSSNAIGMWGDDITLKIRVTDPAGNPVPYVTIWGVTNPGSFSNSDQIGTEENWAQLNFDDLWRNTLRYQGSFELAHHFYWPIRGITIYTMTNAAGEASYAINFKDMAIQTRPRSTEIGLSFMRREYLPEKAQLFADASQSTLKLKVVLQPSSDAIVARKESEYLNEFDRIRYELSDWRRNEKMSGGNSSRLEQLRSEMENAAAQALSVGDKKSAAKIYSRMETMPEVRKVDGKIVGYAQTDIGSERNRTAIQKAIELDPENDYFAMRAIREKGRILKATFSGDINEYQKEQLRDYLKQRLQVLAKHGGGAWMFDQAGVFYDYVELEMYSEAYQELSRLKKFEPRGNDYDGMLKILKHTMQRKNIPVPTDW